MIASKPKRNNAIEFWRFICSLMIVFYHFGIRPGGEGTKAYFGYGGVVVSFFCVVSGFFFMRSFVQDKNMLNPIKGTAKILWRKLKEFAPIWYICLFISICIRLQFYNFTQAETMDWLKSNWAEFFMLNSIHYNINHINGPSWYISGLIVTCVIFFFVLSLSKRFLHIHPIIISGIFIVAFSYIKYNAPYYMYGLDYLYRMIPMFCAGIVTYYINEKLNKIQWKYLNLAYQIAEIIVIPLFWCFVLMDDLAQSGELAFDVVTVMFVIITLQNRTVVTRMLDTKLSAFLGKISLGIYMIHISLLMRWGWMAPFNVQQNPVLAYIGVTIDVVIVGSMVVAFCMALKTLPKMIKSGFNTREKACMKMDGDV